MVTLAASVAVAHHSFAMFDITQTRTISGTVRTFQFKYPHSWLWIDVPNASGGTDPWGFESAGPAELYRFSGWTRTTVRPGDKVSVKYCPMRDGRNAGAFISVVLPDGRAMAGAANFCVINNAAEAKP
jgi:hypothetical protein